MEKLSNIPFVKKLFEKGKMNIIVLIGLVGVLLIAASEFLPAKAEKPVTENTSLDAYRSALESDLTQILSSVNGVGEVNVMITLESSQENIYAQQEKSTDDTQTVSGDRSVQETMKTTYENQFVMVDENSGKTALVEKTLQPAVQGVVVVCKGAGDISVVSDVTNAVAVALNVSSNRICVIKMQ